MKGKFIKILKQYLFIALGVIILNFGYYFFIDSKGLVIGGMMGLATFLTPYIENQLSWFSTSIFLYIANAICLIIGGLLLGKDFFLKTIFATFFSPTVLLIFENVFDANYFISHLSSAGEYIIPLICGSVLSGIGLGIALKNNGSTGGMDVIQKIMSKYLHVPYSKTMYLTDWAVVLISGFMFTGTFFYDIELVIYGLVAVYVISLIIDKIVLNAKSRRTAYIITDKPIEIRDIIYDRIGRGVTFCDVRGAYTDIKRTMVICTMDKSEAYRLSDYVKEIDETAFTFISSTNSIIGEYEQRKGIL